MKNIKRVISFIAIILLFVSGCSCNITDSYYPEEELYVKTSFDSAIYVYSDKAAVTLSNMGTDYLKLRTSDSSDWVSSGYDVLSGDFEACAWHDNKLFIRLNSYICYVFDISAYEPGKYTIENTPEFSLKKYSIEKAEEKYPDFNDFEWYSN